MKARCGGGSRVHRRAAARGQCHGLQCVPQNSPTAVNTCGRWDGGHQVVPAPREQPADPAPAVLAAASRSPPRAIPQVTGGPERRTADYVFTSIRKNRLSQKRNIPTMGNTIFHISLGPRGVSPVTEDSGLELTTQRQRKCWKRGRAARCSCLALRSLQGTSGSSCYRDTRNFCEASTVMLGDPCQSTHRPRFSSPVKYQTAKGIHALKVLNRFSLGKEGQVQPTNRGPSVRHAALWTCRLWTHSPVDTQPRGHARAL